LIKDSIVIENARGAAPFDRAVFGKPRALDHFAWVSVLTLLDGVADVFSFAFKEQMVFAVCQCPILEGFWCCGAHRFLSGHRPITAQGCNSPVF
jgi:hypothetical protein